MDTSQELVWVPVPYIYFSWLTFCLRKYYLRPNRSLKIKEKGKFLLEPVGFNFEVKFNMMNVTTFIFTHFTNE